VPNTTRGTSATVVAKSPAANQPGPSGTDVRRADSRLVVLAVPSEGEGGTEAQRAEHFGRCDCFTVVEIDGGHVKGVRVVANPPHGSDGCLGPVRLLASSGVTALVVGGIGARPLAGLRAAGIAVYFEPRCTTVNEAVEAVRSGAACPIEPQWACGE
jgi:predicted Fe-Mo cluster-binding NifX family protein